MKSTFQSPAASTSEKTILSVLRMRAAGWKNKALLLGALATFTLSSCAPSRSIRSDFQSWKPLESSPITVPLHQKVVGPDIDLQFDAVWADSAAVKIDTLSMRFRKADGVEFIFTFPHRANPTKPAVPQRYWVRIPAQTDIESAAAPASPSQLPFTIMREEFSQAP